MALTEERVNVLQFLNNLFWLNMKKLRGSFFWRLILVAINFGMFYAALSGYENRILLLFFGITSLSNVLMMYIRTGAKVDSTSLLRSMGASRTFVLVDNLIEIMLEFLIAAVIAIALLPFFKTAHWLFRMAGWEFLAILVFSPIFSSVLLARIERQHRKI
jgi:membrane-associated HD superfamily phosphohydrolase